MSNFEAQHSESSPSLSHPISLTVKQAGKVGDAVKRALHDANLVEPLRVLLPPGSNSIVIEPLKSTKQEPIEVTKNGLVLRVSPRTSGPQGEQAEVKIVIARVLSRAITYNALEAIEGFFKHGQVPEEKKLLITRLLNMSSQGRAMTPQQALYVAVSEHTRELENLARKPADKLKRVSAINPQSVVADNEAFLSNVARVRAVAELIGDLRVSAQVVQGTVQARAESIAEPLAMTLYRGEDSRSSALLEGLAQLHKALAHGGFFKPLPVFLRPVAPSSGIGALEQGRFGAGDFMSAPAAVQATGAGRGGFLKNFEALTLALQKAAEIDRALRATAPAEEAHIDLLIGLIELSPRVAHVLSKLEQGITTDDAADLAELLEVVVALRFNSHEVVRGYYELISSNYLPKSEQDGGLSAAVEARLAGDYIRILQILAICKTTSPEELAPPLLESRNDLCAVVFRALRAGVLRYQLVLNEALQSEEMKYDQSWGWIAADTDAVEEAVHVLRKVLPADYLNQSAWDEMRDAISSVRSGYSTLALTALSDDELVLNADTIFATDDTGFLSAPVAALSRRLAARASSSLANLTSDGSIKPLVDFARKAFQSTSSDQSEELMKNLVAELTSFVELLATYGNDEVSKAAKPESTLGDVSEGFAALSEVVLQLDAFQRELMEHKSLIPGALWSQAGECLAKAPEQLQMLSERLIAIFDSRRGESIQDSVVKPLVRFAKDTLHLEDVEGASGEVVTIKEAVAEQLERVVGTLTSYGEVSFQKATRSDSTADDVVQGLAVLSFLMSEFRAFESELRQHKGVLPDLLWSQVAVRLDQMPKRFELSLRNNPVQFAQAMQRLCSLRGESGDAELRSAAIAGLKLLRIAASRLDRQTREAYLTLTERARR